MSRLPRLAFLSVYLHARKKKRPNKGFQKQKQYVVTAQRHSLKPQRSSLYNYQPDKEGFQEGCQIAL